MEGPLRKGRPFDLWVAGLRRFFYRVIGDRPRDAQPAPRTIERLGEQALVLLARQPCGAAADAVAFHDGARRTLAARRPQRLEHAADRDERPAQPAGLRVGERDEARFS